MIEALGLGDDQVSSLNDLHAAREVLQATIGDLIQSGASRADILVMLEDAKMDFDVIADILNGTQLEIFKIHSVLAQRMNNRRGQSGQRQHRSRG